MVNAVNPPNTRRPVWLGKGDVQARVFACTYGRERERETEDWIEIEVRRRERDRIFIRESSFQE